MATRATVLAALNANGVIRKITAMPDESFTVASGPDVGTTVQVEVITLLATNDEETDCQETNRRLYTINAGEANEAAYVIGGVALPVGKTPLQLAFANYQASLLSGTSRAIEKSRNEQAGIVEYTLLTVTGGTPNTYATESWIFWRRPDTGATGQARQV